MGGAGWCTALGGSRRGSDPVGSSTGPESGLAHLRSAACLREALGSVRPSLLMQAGDFLLRQKMWAVLSVL